MFFDFDEKFSPTVTNVAAFATRFVFWSDETVPDNHSLVVPLALVNVAYRCRPELFENWDRFDYWKFEELMQRLIYIRTEAARGTARNYNGHVLFDKRPPLVQLAIDVFDTKPMQEISDEKNVLLLKILTEIKEEPERSGGRYGGMNLALPDRENSNAGESDWRCSDVPVASAVDKADVERVKTAGDMVFDDAMHAALALDGLQLDFWSEYGMTLDLLEHNFQCLTKNLTDWNAEFNFAHRWEETRRYFRETEQIWFALGAPLRSVLLSGLCDENSATEIVKQITDGFLKQYHGGKPQNWEKIKARAEDVLGMLKRRYRAALSSSGTTPLVSASTSALIERLRGENAHRRANGANETLCWFADVSDLPSDLSSKLQSSQCFIVHMDETAVMSGELFHSPPSLSFRKAPIRSGEHMSISWDSLLETARRSNWPVPVVYLLDDVLFTFKYIFKDALTESNGDSNQRAHEGHVIQSPDVQLLEKCGNRSIEVRLECKQLAIKNVVSVSKIEGTFGQLDAIISEYDTATDYAARMNMENNGCCFATPCRCGRCD